MPDESLAAPDRRAGAGTRVLRWWRTARAAALIRSVPATALGDGQPHPALVAPRAHAAIEAIAHPAVLELGAPAWLLLVGSKLWDAELRSLRLVPLEGWVGLFAIQLVVVMVATRAGMWIFKRRYARMAREAYHVRQWRTARAPAVDGREPATTADA